MIFNTFGENDKPIFILIHGIWMPWQCWQSYIDELQKNYYVIVVVLDAHVENEVSEFVSIGDETKKIVNWLVTNCYTNLFAIYGISMGGVIAYRIACDNHISLQKIILDGAPLVATPPFLKLFMKWQYQRLLHQMQQRKSQALIGFEKNFLPKRYLENFLNFADTMTDRSIVNMIDSLGNSQFQYHLNSADIRILYLHGTKINEILSKKTARMLSKLVPATTVISFKGYAHAELAIYHFEECMQVLNQFIHPQS